MDLVEENIREVLNGIVSQHRTAARVAKKNSVRIRIPLEDILKRLRGRLARIDNIVGGETPYFEIPSTVELREQWLPSIIAGGTATLTDDTLELDMIVPPPRKAHAR